MYANRTSLRNPPLEELRQHTSDQKKGIPAPPVEKPTEADAQLIALVPADQLQLGQMPLRDAIRKRESRRSYSNEALSLGELSFILWATQGVRKIDPAGVRTTRIVPSGGCRHPFETYLWVRSVESLAPGLYRYLPIEHALVAVAGRGSAPKASLGRICYRQTFVDEAAVTFVWTAIPYRTEWRYGPDSLKDILLSCGHICQNLYLACEAIGAGTCGILAYDQDELDAFLGVDGKDEISLYVAPVGKVKRQG
jgi:SagB-type dehydrogenase family enzyme